MYPVCPWILPKILEKVENTKYFLTNDTKIVKILTGRLVGKRFRETGNIKLGCEGFACQEVGNIG